MRVKILWPQSAAVHNDYWIFGFIKTWQPFTGYWANLFSLQGIRFLSISGWGGCDVAIWVDSRFPVAVKSQLSFTRDVWLS